ncbi:MAG: DUF3100 domain-containing protein [Gammaproteobacteria bacterium]|nr:DUF3100 domain-containing protein [Gammaproteobacteria bacterium]
MNTSNKFNWLFDIRLHLLVIMLSIASELIGIVKLPIGIGTMVLLPLLYAFVFALLLNPNVMPVTKVLTSSISGKVASYAVILSVMPFIAKFGVGIGPKINTIIEAGPALLLQELGNVATAFIALPVAVIIFKMGREAVGATHSIAREPNIALIADKYGLKSSEGIGVMGVYVVGTLFGAIFFSLLSGIVYSWGIFDVRALAMACGIGSGSMMGACSTALAELVPAQADEITAFAATSNLLTYATGLFVSVFIALPVTNFLYNGLQKIRKTDGKKIDINTEDTDSLTAHQTLDFTQNCILLAVICFVLLLSNWVGKSVDPLAALPGMGILYACCITGIIIRKFVKFAGIPAIAWISIIAIIISLPQSPINELVKTETEKLGVLQLITPVLAYAGFAISKLEVDLFKKAGIKLVIVALLTFTGTFIGSVVIADALL